MSDDQGKRLTYSNYSIAEIADILSLHINTIRRAIKQGRIKSVKFGDSHRIAAAELERILTAGFTLDPQLPTRGRPRKIS
jgi:excisionase family DNA binding protein